VTTIAIVRDYETLYIVDSNLTDEQLQTLTEKYRQIVTQAGGEVIATEKWDKRRLAYEVAGKREGIYILMYFRSETPVASELNRVMKISEDVMRHLIVRDELGQAAAAKERAERPAHKPAERPAPVVEAAPAETPAETEAPVEVPEVEAAAPEVTEAPAETAETSEISEPAESEAPQTEAAE
jgi:small subunit ribosomal protein S6